MTEQQELAPKGAKKTKAKEPAWGEGRILAALRERFAPPAFAFFPHVRNQTGYSRTVRTADAIAMSLFPSRGLHITGVEVKSDRYDWVRELKDPAKAEEIAQHTDFWVLAVGDRDIVQPGELPINWGLLAPVGKALKMVVEPKLIGARDERIARLFLAAILRRAMEDSPGENAVKEAIAVAKAEWEEAAEGNKDWRIKRAEEDAKGLRQRIENFEKASGMRIDNWNLGKVGAAINALIDCERTDYLANQLDNAAKKIAAAADEVRSARVVGVTVPPETTP